jgi:Na+-translocating ferredoxin:NAD+ oxidoreductase RnfC subunit/Na+-translocating ferredoxin:NAD+ oxidoreductase RnfD subunit
VGDHVREGMLVGRGQGMGSANVHATVPGKVIKMISWKMTDGKTNDALVIRMEGSFEKLGKKVDSYPWEGMLPYDLQRVISEYGVVEMEGLGRPVSDIIASLRNVSEPITLVVRCVFDDPWLAADYVLCKERLKAVIEGSKIIARTVRANRILYAVSHGEKELGQELMAAVGNWEVPSLLALVGSRYPQRNRRELDLVLRNYGKREGLELGSLLILGPASLAAVHDAVKLKRPILDRYVAVGGSAVRSPQVMKVRIGTRIGEVFNQCGGFVRPPRRIAAGSPLSGRALADLNEPIVKNSYAVFALLEGAKPPEPAGCCISCGECRNVCPVGLDPEELYKRTRLSGTSLEDMPPSRAAECHGCGCCDVVCPSGLPLSSAITVSALKGNYMGENSSAFYERLQSHKPQVNLAQPTVWRMWLVSLCAFMVVIQSSLTDNFSSFFLAFVCAAAAVITEFLILYQSGRAAMVKDGSAVATALILTLFLPNKISPGYAILGSVFAIAVVKHSFGGLGSNWLNPAAGGWLFVRFAWPGAFNKALEGSPLSFLSESLSRGFSNPLGSPLEIFRTDSAFFQTSGLDSLMRGFFNETVFSLTGAELPGGYIDLFSAAPPGIIADRGVLALLVGTIIITATRANRAWIPALWLGVYCLLVRSFGALPYGGGWWDGDMLFGLFSGGTLAAAFLLASDPVTSAKSNLGILGASMVGGLFAWLFRYGGAEPYGAVFAVAVVNALLPIVHSVESRYLYEKRSAP